MAKYIIKHNLHNDGGYSYSWDNAKNAKTAFMGFVKSLTEKFATKVVFRTKPLRGTIQVEIDGFFYYVELYEDKDL